MNDDQKRVYEEDKQRRLVNVSGIDFEENENGPEESVFFLRHGTYTPIDFRQPLITRHYDNLIDKAEKVLEVGCGTGRNAQYFLNQTNHIKYYGVDASPLSLKCFENNTHWDFSDKKDRYYISNQIDETILSQEYDLIFSSYVLQHIGFASDNTKHDCLSITRVLVPHLKVGGYWLSYETSSSGQMGWESNPWRTRTLEYMPNLKVCCVESCQLAGCGPPPHELNIFQKIGE